MNMVQAEQLALNLMRYHGVRDYTFSFMQPRRRFNRAGQCNWKKKTIQLAPQFVELNHPFIVKQTILHEIAHALKPKHHHNKFWRQQAKELGCVRGRCYGKEVKK